MKTTLIFLFVCFVPFAGFSQDLNIKGIIVDNDHNVAIPYATIGIINENIGTVSDDNGKFQLSLSKESIAKLSDYEIIISCVGYESKKMPISSLQKNEEVIIKLNPQTYEMSEVHVTSKKTKEKTYGNRWRSRFTSISFFDTYEEVDDALGKEMGKILKVDDNIKLTEFGFYVNGNVFDSVKFRLNFYNLTDTIPEKINLEKDIIFDITADKGWFEIDLSPYNIYLKRMEKIGVTIQWIKSSGRKNDNNYFGIPAGMISFNGALSRQKSESEWGFFKLNLSMYLKALKFETP